MFLLLSDIDCWFSNIKTLLWGLWSYVLQTKHLFDKQQIIMLFVISFDQIIEISISAFAQISIIGHVVIMSAYWISVIVTQLKNRHVNTWATRETTEVIIQHDVR